MTGCPDGLVSDTARVTANDIEALFQLGTQSREGRRNFMQALPSEEWDRLQATPRKIVVQVLMHEIRRTQVATICV